ncbi:hypothetical protein BJF93_18795 [Xaviernesmea oryzae]|uniref:Uncharacterized protein n=1 Tax=Xaviernesmea oryzae TaxID=464029 RepID=A0A1Q9B2M3_9HYPH|nr:hypothetical protein [Xaviernesmea oryzae]OLP62265.1 hypothetical protein BJF93_18795 [Xaviernesmea oryzae]SEL93839.1 hypothetical protein SAMN04487976_11592 [Xaviernesmea oryzae]
MLKGATLNLPEDLVVRVQAHAQREGTTLTAIVREHLDALTQPETPLAEQDPLLAYSKGLIARREAIDLLELRDYADLLVALGDADLPMPPMPDVEQQAATFVHLWNLG